MFKRIIISLVAVTISIQTWGQSDRYTNIHETIGHTVQLYNIEKLYDMHQPFIYRMNDKGKLVKDKELQTYTQLHNNYLKVVGIEMIKKKSYWILDYQGSILYLLLEDIDYCENIKSVSFWEKKYQSYSQKYSHYISSKASKDKLISYQPIIWGGFEMPQNLKETPTFEFRAGDSPTMKISPSKINFENGFLTGGEYSQIKKDIEERIRLEILEQERKDSIADLNHIIQLRIARKPITYEYFEQNGIFEDAPKFKHLYLDIIGYSEPSKYTTYSIEKAWDYYLTIFDFNPIKNTLCGYCKGVEVELPRAALAESLSPEDEQYLIRRWKKMKGVEVRRKVAYEHDKAFFASSKHLEKVMHLKPDNKPFSKNEIIGRRYIVKKEYYSFQFNPLRVIATNEALTNNISRKEIFTCVDIVHKDNTLSTGYDIVIFENPKYGYCYLESYYYIDSYLDEYEKVINNNQKRKEWEKRMIEKYGEVNGKTIIQGKVRVGFTAEMCRDSWGKPSDINRTTTAYGAHEQWVYGYGCYLYFEDGILTTIQN